MLAKLALYSYCPSALFYLGVFQSVWYKMNEEEDNYVDGGFLCNYPIHAFDGKIIGEFYFNESFP